MLTSNLVLKYLTNNLQTVSKLALVEIKIIRTR